MSTKIPQLTVAEVSSSLLHFSILDYGVFGAMLFLCALIGIYFGCRKTPTSNKAGQDVASQAEQAEDEYLMGGRQMQTIPVSMSLIASYISGITLIGMPTEVYVYGMQIIYIIVAMVLFAILFPRFFLPVFYELRLTTLYQISLKLELYCCGLLQYLQMRYDRRMRLFGSILFTVSLIAWLPIVIYVPALAFNQVTGVNVHIVTPIVCLVCIFYTCLGGMKAVVWTDVIQTVSMFGCILIVAYKGTVNVGGPCVVFRRGLQSGRIEPPVMDPDPLVRQSFWTTALGDFSKLLVSSGLSQSMMQRYLALPSEKAAVRSAWFFVIGCSVIFLLCGYCGLLIFATYHDCDPLTTKLARQKDQLLPLLVMDTLGEYPGMAGLFVAGVFSAALSSLSTGLNSMSAVVVEDFVRPYAGEKLTQKHINLLMRGVVVVFGFIFVAIVFAVEHLGAVLQLTSSLSSIANGPVLAIFLEGIFMPWVDSTASLSGTAVGLCFSAWLVLGAQAAIVKQQLVFAEKPVSVAGCHYTFNTTIVDPTPHSFVEPAMWIFRISYHWYTPLAASVAIMAANIIAFLRWYNGKIDIQKVDPRLVSSVCRKWVRSKTPITHHPSELATDKYDKQTFLDRDIPLHGPANLPVINSEV